MCDIGNNGNWDDNGDRGECSWGNIGKGSGMFDVSDMGDKSEGAYLRDACAFKSSKRICCCTREQVVCDMHV